MYTPGLLLLGVLVLVVLSQREHLTISAPMVDIRNTATQAEQDRIFAMAPTSLQSRATATNTAMGNPVDRSKSFVAGIIRDFQAEIYVPATAPITEAVVTAWVATKKTAYGATATSPLTSFYLDAYSNGDAKRLVMSYLGLTSGATIPPVSPPPTSSTSAISIPNVLAGMRDNLLEYKMTGDLRYKTAYDGAKGWMDRYVATLNTQLTREADAITNDVATYRNANQEMTQTQNDFQRIKAEGPKAENTYLTIKRQMDQIPVASASNDSYIKVGIAAGLALGAGVLAFV
jgi:hypothetical protein